MYLKYFNFIKAPFELTPNADFFYFSAIHQDVYKTLMYGIENLKGFLVLTGPVGSGKTTISRLIMDKIHSSETIPKIKIAYIFNPTLSFVELLKNMLIDFGVRFNKKENSKVYLLESLNKFLIKEYSENRIVATIIDESQLISIETLEEIRLLTNLETNNHKLIQIILCGQPDFDRIINSDRLQQLKQRINFYCHLLPLSFEEMINYINHRMHIAGRPEPVPITENALKLIYFYSKGIPRIVNSICDKSMISAYAYDKSEVNVNCVVSGIQMLEGNTDRKKVYIELFKIMISRYYRYAFWITIIFFLALIYLSKIMNV